MSSFEVPNIGPFEHTTHYSEFGRTLQLLRDPSTGVDLHLTEDGIQKLTTDEPFNKLLQETAQNIVSAGGFYNTNIIKETQPGLTFVHESGYEKHYTTAVYSDAASHSIIKGTVQKNSRRYGIVPLSTMDRLAAELALLEDDTHVHIGAAKQYALLVKDARPTTLMEHVPGIRLEEFLTGLQEKPSELHANEIKEYVLDAIAKKVTHLPNAVRARMNDVNQNHLHNILIAGNPSPDGKINVHLIDQPNMDILASAGFMATAALKRFIKKS